MSVTRREALAQLAALVALSVPGASEQATDPLDGTVWRADLSITIPDATGQTSTPDLIGDITLVFQDHKEWGILVPATMTERYVLRNGEEDDGRAEYSNFRRFQVRTDEKLAEP